MRPFLNQQLTQSLLVEVASGYYADDGKFLSNRKICNLWKVSETTAKVSLAKLVSEGILHVRPRSGYRVTAGAQKRALLLLHKGSAPHLPPPATWDSIRYKLRNPGQPGRRRIALVIDGAETPRSQPLFQVPPLVSSALVCTRAFFETAVQHDSEVIYYLNNGQAQIQREITASLLQQRPDGVAIFRRTYVADHSPMTIPLIAANIPVVSVFDNCKETKAISININNVGTGYDAARLLLAKGHRRLAFLGRSIESDIIRERLQGFEMAMDESGLTGLDLKVLPLSALKTLTRRELADVKKALTGPDRVTALFSPYVGNMVALQPILTALRLRVPADLSVIACGCPSLLPAKTFPYDLMDLDFTSIGRRAFQRLWTIIEGNPVSRGELIDPPHLKRGTVKKIRQRV